MTPELRLLVAAPIAASRSTTITSRPARASALATASPTTPAPITTLWVSRSDPSGTRSASHRPRRARQDAAIRGETWRLSRVRSVLEVLECRDPQRLDALEQLRACRLEVAEGIVPRTRIEPGIEAWRDLLRQFPNDLLVR